MVANFLIGLREGLEAVLVVAILAAYLVRSGRSEQCRWLWVGVVGAIVVSLAAGAALTFTSQSLDFTAQEAFGGFASLIAVALVTWMVFWMRRNSRGLRGDLHGRAERALSTGGRALAVVGFVAVGREGLETALFVWSATQVTGSTLSPLLGASAGLGCAALAGWLFYRGALRLNLRLFFRWSGAALVVVAAGVLAYAVHDLQEASLLPGLDRLAFDVSAVVPPDSWYGSLLKGTVGFTPATTWLQAIAWLAYLPPVLIAYFRPAGVDAPAESVGQAALPSGPAGAVQRHGPRAHPRPFD